MIKKLVNIKPRFRRKCDICGKEDAIYNVQKIWIRWDYNAKLDEYSKDFVDLPDIEEPTGDENLFLCQECYDKWRYGDI